MRGGNPSITGTLAITIGQLNPFRYRGYVWDSETGLFYVNSRYYNPSWGRWINADSQLNPTQYDGYNTFAYCSNNPVNMIDPSGHVGYSIHDYYYRMGGYNLSSENEYYAKFVNSSGNIKYFLKKAKSYKVSDIAICTDGSTGPQGGGLQIPDGNWLPSTAYCKEVTKDGKKGELVLDAYTVPYIVLPGSGSDKNAARLGQLGLLINHDTGQSVECIVGERAGKDSTVLREVSIAAIWATGNPNHMTAKSNAGLGKNYEIVLFPGLSAQWDWSSSNTNFVQGK